MLILSTGGAWLTTAERSRLTAVFSLPLAIGIGWLLNKPLLDFSLLISFFSTESLRLIMAKKPIKVLSNQAKEPEE